MNHWLGGPRVLLRTRQARRNHDAGAALRALTRGADTAVGLRIRGRHILLLLTPELAGELLCGHAADTTKGPGVQLTRGLLGNGLLTSEGETHRRARRLVAPAFSPRRLAGYTDTFARCAQAHSEGWRDGQAVDMHHEMAALTLEIVGRTLLGLDLSAQAPQVRAGLESALAQFSGDGFAIPGRRRLGRLVGRSRSQPVLDDRPGAGVHQLIRDIVDERRRSPTSDRGDVISALLAASAEPDGLSADEVHDNVMTLLMAGHETTANALSWTMDLLGRHPEVRLRLEAEVDGLGGELPTVQDLPGLTYTRAVISEAIRLYPPAWIIGRSTATPLELGGWHVPAGSVVAVSPLLLHHDPRWFPDPEVFDPDRWLDGRRDLVPRHAYLPFGTGPRACIGEQFAWMEATTVLAVLTQSWTAEPELARAPSGQYRVTLRPAGGLPMTLHSRRPDPSRLAS